MEGGGKVFVPYIDPPTAPCSWAGRVTDGRMSFVNQSQLNFRTEGQETLRQRDRQRDVQLAASTLHEASSGNIFRKLKRGINPDVSFESVSCQTNV